MKYNTKAMNTCFKWVQMLNSSLSLCLVLIGGQLRNKLNQDQNSKLQQQRESLNKRNLEVASMDKRINELRDRLWKKKAALQQKENLPVSIITHRQHNNMHTRYVTYLLYFVKSLDHSYLFIC